VTSTDRHAAREMLLASAATGDTILVKASRGAALDELVQDLVRAGGGALPGPEAPES
jgi:UDP-N-acetylmuramyl pentapeptide synthase